MSTGRRYAIDITSAAQRDLKRFRKNCSLRHLVEDIDRKILALRDNPRPQGAIKLKNGKPPCEYRIRESDYRVLYSINDARRVVTIGRVLDRKEAY